MSQTSTQSAPSETDNIAQGVDNEIVTSNQRVFAGVVGLVVTTLCIAYTMFHVGAMNGIHDRITDFLGLPSVDLTEPWRYRLAHVAGGLALGFILFSGHALLDQDAPKIYTNRQIAILYASVFLVFLMLGPTLRVYLYGDSFSSFWPFVSDAESGKWRLRLIDFSAPFSDPILYLYISLLGAMLALAALIAAPNPTRFYNPVEKALTTIGTGMILLAFGQVVVMLSTGDRIQTGAPAEKHLLTFGYPLFAGTVLMLLASWIQPTCNRNRLSLADTMLAVAAIVVGIYIIGHADFLRTRAQVFPHPNDMWASIAGIILILELTRRLAGLALVIIVGVFLAYGFVGPYLPGILNHRGYAPARFFGFIYTDNGILGPTTAISSTYIILFITFAAFLQASRVGEYFVNFAFAAAGGTRGGPAKVAVFASGLMGMINGTSAGNVVSTGSLTIPLMKKVGYKPQTSASVEAAASSGGQILPPIMGAGAFIMAEITGIQYREIVIAAIIPAILYFTSVYFMVDKEALKKGMKGLPRDMLPQFDVLARRAFLFIPIFILIGALFMGYSVIRAGTLAMASAAAVSWFTPNKMLLREILYAFEIAARMSLQLVAVCAAAGIIVGVIALTGIGTRFSSLLLGFAGQSQILALVFAMFVAIILGMGMPTTAAYAVAAAVIAPGLIRMGIEPLTAHFFIFYYAVMSAITPPVALAAYAGAAIAQSDPMRTSVESFKIGLAAFIVPFIFFFNDGLLMQGDWGNIIHVFFTALLGIYLLASAVQGWLFGVINWPLRLIVGAAAIAMISGGWLSDAIGLGVAAAVFLLQKNMAQKVGAERA